MSKEYEQWQKQLKAFRVYIEPLLPPILVEFLKHPKSDYARGNSNMWDDWTEDVFESWGRDFKLIKKKVEQNYDYYGKELRDYDEMDEWCTCWFWLFCYHGYDFEDFYYEDDEEGEFERNCAQTDLDVWEGITDIFQYFCVMRFYEYL